MKRKRLLILCVAMGGAILGGTVWDGPGVARHARAADAKAGDASSLPTLTEAEKRDGWILLFDGTSSKGWHQLGAQTFPDKVWAIEQGCLRHLPTGKASNADLIYAEPVENFELSWEWRIPKEKGNSGLKYRVPEGKPAKGGAYGPEYQMMADGDVIDKNATASLYDVLPPTKKPLKPTGEWNSSRLRVVGNDAEHWLNGEKVLTYTFWTPEFNAAVAKSKFKGSPIWGKTAKGYIALTDHGDESWFRNIKLRRLEAK